jgi:hypothetical protein
MFQTEPATTLTKSKLRPRRTGASKAVCDLENAPNYPFPSKEAMICKLIVDTNTKQIEELRIIPIYVNDEGQPIPAGHSADGQKVVDTLIKLTEQYEFGTQYTWDGGEVVVTPQ